MRISVVTVTLNSADALRRTVSSLRQQRYEDIDYVVVDGASTDHTKDVIADSPDFVGTFVSEPDKGIYDAMNKGFRLASGDVIGFLNAGDVFASADVTGIVAKAFDDPEIDICYGDLAYAPTTGPIPNRFWKSSSFSPGMFLRGWMPPHPGFFVRRRVYEQLGGFDSRYRISGDYDFMLRALEVARLRARYIASPLVIMEQGGESTRSAWAIMRANWECLQSRRRNGLPAMAHLLLLKPLSKLLQLRR